MAVKIGIISDTHGLLRQEVVENLKDRQVVIFGHSHKYFQEIIDGRLWLNPGSCGHSRFGGDVTMAVMIVENGSYQVEKIVIPTVAI